MNRKLLYISAMFLIMFYSFSVEKKPGYPYKNRALPVNERVADLLKRMTLDEKIRQLDMFWGKEIANMQGHEANAYSEEKAALMIGSKGIGSVHDLYPLNPEIANKIQKYAIENTRLGIPVLFIEEGLHGYSGFGSTSFPIPLQLAAAWDTALVYKVGRVIATETRAHGVNMILGPVLCLPRDARWGRVEETYGEDPYLTALNGVAMVKGLQGRGLSYPDAVLAEPKHFAVHGIPEAGSNTAPVNIGEREARSSFLYVFEKSVREGGAMGMMAAYSEIDGIPCVQNRWLLTDILRKEWGFNGMVLSDLGAIKMSLENHKTAANVSDALTRSFSAGMSMQFYDFGHDEFLKAMKEALANRSLALAELDRAAGDVLRVKFMLGLFDQPFVDPDRKQKVFHTKESQALALKAAQEGICLLKNDKGVLPLKNENLHVAVIGSLAKSTYPGGYSNPDAKALSILDGLRQRASASVRISFAEGYVAGKSRPDLIQEAVDAVSAADVAVVVLGEDVNIVGEGKDRATLDLDENQTNLIKAVCATGKPVVAVLFNGRPLTIKWVAENVPAVVENWFPGESGGLATADVLFGNVNPAGKLPMSCPRSIGQLPFYYNHKPTSYHKYVDETDSVLFAFGHGLSYTTFEYSALKISPPIAVNGTANISVSVKNTGKVAGTEVVQLYIRDVVSSVTTPVKSLKGFKRITLKPGEKGNVNFTLPAKELALWNSAMKRVVEPGEFKVMVGSSSADIRQEGILIVAKQTSTGKY